MYRSWHVCYSKQVTIPLIIPRNVPPLHSPSCLPRTALPTTHLLIDWLPASYGMPELGLAWQMHLRQSRPRRKWTAHSTVFAVNSRNGGRTMFRCSTFGLCGATGGRLSPKKTSWMPLTRWACVQSACPNLSERKHVFRSNNDFPCRYQRCCCYSPWLLLCRSSDRERSLAQRQNTCRSVNHSNIFFCDCV